MHTEICYLNSKLWVTKILGTRTQSFMKPFYFTKVVNLLTALCVFDEIILFRITNQTVSQLLIQNDKFSKLIYKFQQFNKVLIVRSSIYSVCALHRLEVSYGNTFIGYTLVLILFSLFLAFQKYVLENI